MLEERCFDNVDAADSYRSQQNARGGIYTLFTIWRDAGFGGGFYEWWTDLGCSGDYGFNDFNVIGWNDSAGSARASCGRTVALWEHTYQSGASLWISGWQSGLGVLDDESSSWDMAF